jgi:hypothetical protein
MSQNLQDQHLDQAIHNESACDFLNTNSKFYDWIVTSAFYSALHYVSSVIFPISHRSGNTNSKADTIGQYCTLLGTRDNKHKVMTDLVYANCRGIGTSYKALLDMSYSSRYESGCQGSSYSVSARRYLSQIKSHCEAKTKSKKANFVLVTAQQTTTPPEVVATEKK